MRHAPVEMEIDAALILRIGVLEIVGEAADAGEFRACRRVQIGVAGAEVDGAVTDADIGEPVGIVIADGNVTGTVHHVIVDAVVPLQLERRIKIAIGNQRVLKESLECVAKRPPVKVPAMLAEFLPQTPARVADNWPPSTGSANV